MYYIINQSNQIIAIDNMLLEQLQIKDIEELQFTLSTEDHTTITYKNNTYQFHAHIHVLSSILGNLRLVHLQEIQVKESEENPIDTEGSTSNHDNLNNLAFKDNTQEDKDSLSISPALKIQKEEVKKEFSTLTFQNETSETIDEIVLESKDIPKEEIPLKKSSTLDNTSIFIDIKNTSKIIGISQDDYKSFLNEYIDNAISLEESLRGNNKEKRIAATETLTQLANVLQLPKVNEVISKIDTLSSDDRPQMINIFYTLLSRLTVHTKPKENVKNNKEKQSTNGFGLINLQDVKPIQLNFQISQVADALSLPKELIEKFVHDFIEQVHEKTEQILKAYEEGNLNTIQEISRFLKSTSSNLRIKEISDILDTIQFSEDSSQIEKLIKEYWGYFLSLEQQFDSISKKGNS